MQPNADPTEAKAESGAAEAATDGDQQAVAALVEAQLQQGYADGFARGFEAGREQGEPAGFAEGTEAARAEMTETARRLAALVERLGSPIAALEQQVEEALAGLALEIA